MKQMQKTLPVTAVVRDRLAIQLRERRPTTDAILSERYLDRQGNFLAKAGCLFGADVGGTKVQSVITDLNGNVLAETRSATPSHSSDAVLTVIDDHMVQLGEQVRFDIVAAGIGLPGTINPVTGYLERAPNLRGFDGRDMRALLSERYEIPVAIENDVNFAALGEFWKGHGATLDASTGGLAFIALGTGIGMGLVWGDCILRGSIGAAGEIAALPIGGDAFNPNTHACGALESVVSGAALVADYRDCGGMNSGQTLREITTDGVTDPLLDAITERLAKNVALAVLSVDAIINPSLFVFGGGIGSQKALLERIQSNLVLLMPNGMPVPDCRMSELGNRAGVLGAVRAARLSYADHLTEQKLF